MKNRFFLEIKKIKSEFDNLIKKQGKEKVLTSLYVIFSLFSITVFGLFAIRPTLTTIAELSKEKEDSESTLANLKIKNQNLQKLSAQYNQIEKSLQLVYDAIPTSSKIPELTRKIESLAEKNNLVIEDLDTDAIELYPAERTSTPLFSYTISVTAAGLESSINQFTQEIINIDRILSIEKVSSGRKETGSFSTTITARSYFLKE